jgi:hypothetical protein
MSSFISDLSQLCMNDTSCRTAAFCTMSQTHWFPARPGPAVPMPWRVAELVEPVRRWHRTCLGVGRIPSAHHPLSERGIGHLVGFSACSEYQLGGQGPWRFVL